MNASLPLFAKLIEIYVFIILLRLHFCAEASFFFLLMLLGLEEGHPGAGLLRTLRAETPGISLPGPGSVKVGGKHE